MNKVKITISLFSILFVFSLFFSITAEAAKKEVEPNNVKEKARVIQQEDYGVEGTISDSNDVDFYRVDLSKQGTYRFDSILGNVLNRNRNYYNSYKLNLYNSNGQLIKTSTPI